MRRLTTVAAVGVALGHGACTSSSKTVLATGGAAGLGGEDAASGAEGSGAAASDSQAGGATGGSSGALLPDRVAAHYDQGKAEGR